MLPEKKSETREGTSATTKLRSRSRSSESRAFQSGASVGRSGARNENNFSEKRKRLSSLSYPGARHRRRGTLRSRTEHGPGTQQSGLAFSPGAIEVAERFEDPGGTAARGSQPVVDGVDPRERNNGDPRGHLAGGRGWGYHRSPRPRSADNLLTRGGPSEHRSAVALTPLSYQHRKNSTKKTLKTTPIFPNH